MPELRQDLIQPVSAAMALRQLWLDGKQPGFVEFVSSFPQLSPSELSDLVRIDQRERWHIGERPLAESYLDGFPELQSDQPVTADIVYQEFLLRERFHEAADHVSLAARFPGITDVLQQQIAFHLAMTQVLTSDAPTSDSLTEDTNSCDEDSSDHLPDFPGYELLGVLAFGGMSTVYEAIHLALNRHVAIKVMADPMPTKQSRQRFAREAQAIATLTHDNIVRVFDVSEIKGRPYLVLEFIDGGTLSDHYRGHVVPPRDAAHFVGTLARAIQHCHDNGIVHRDLKPGNILLQHTTSPLEFEVDGEGDIQPLLSSWTPKITDFGLSKMQTVLAEAHPTRSGAIMGTPAYMSPEQATGDAANIKPPTDIYSLGTVLYELLTGRPPFQGQTPLDVVQQVVRNNPIAPSRLTRGLPLAIETICLKCLNKQPSKRYLTCHDLAEDLNRYLARVPIAARPASAIEKMQFITRAHPVRSLLAGAAVLVVAMGWLALNVHERTLRRTQTTAMVASLATADTSRIMSIIEKLNQNPSESRLALTSAPSPVDRTTATLHLQFAKAYFEATDQRDLLAWVPTASAMELELLCGLPKGFSTVAKLQLWEQLANSQLNPGSRLRVAGVLASSDRTAMGWEDCADAIVAGVVREPVFDLPRWTRLLQPIRDVIRAPLEIVLHSPTSSQTEKLVAASILANHFMDSPVYIAELAVDSHSEPSMLAILHDVYKSSFDVKPPKGETQSSPKVLAYLSQSLHHARRKTLSAITLAHLGEQQPLRELLGASPDPTARSYAIDWMAPAKLPVQWLIRSLTESTDPATKRSCVLALGQFDRSSLGESEQEQTVALLNDLASSESDPGFQGALAWLSKRWHLPPPPLTNFQSSSERSQPSVTRPMWANSQNQVFVTVLPTTAQIGSPEWEEEREHDEPPRAARVAYPFAINRTEITVAEARRFRADFHNNNRYSPDPSSPAGNLSFFDAAAYCRWLSELEGIADDQICFPPMDEIKPGMQLPENYLERSGYRIPTEDEWEIACRAGSSVSWCFGTDSALMPLYGVSLFKPLMGTDVVGSSKPNDWGLFEMHGNVREWCFNLYDVRPEQRRSDLKMFKVDESSPRITKGGAFSDIPWSTRSARLSADLPSVRYAIIGFRCVRTISSSSTN